MSTSTDIQQTHLSFTQTVGAGNSIDGLAILSVSLHQYTVNILTTTGNENPTILPIILGIVISAVIIIIAVVGFIVYRKCFRLSNSEKDASSGVTV